MSIRSTRGRSVAGGAALLGILGLASAASACAPGAANTTNFVVTPDSAKTGTPMRAVGTDIERGNWPYTIKLVAGTLNTSGSFFERSRCGREGIPQVVAKTSDGTPESHLDNRDPLYHTATEDGWAAHDFDVPFVLNAAGLAPGAAHLCAIPGAEPNTSSIVATTPYFDPSFTIV